MLDRHSPLRIEVAGRLPLSKARRGHELLTTSVATGTAINDEDAPNGARRPRWSVGLVVSAGAPQVHYLPIAEHGLIGDLHTVALVGTDGTIDCYCCPRFDSPSVFAAILDADHGGLFRISPDCDGWRSKQLYTNILITRFLTPDGVGEAQDFMPPPQTGEAVHHHRTVRQVLAVRGQMHFIIDVPRASTTGARATRSR